MVRDTIYLTTIFQHVLHIKELEDMGTHLEQLSFNLEARYGTKLREKVERSIGEAEEDVRGLERRLEMAREKVGKCKEELGMVERQSEEGYVEIEGGLRGVWG